MKLWINTLLLTMLCWQGKTLAAVDYADLTLTEGALQQSNWQALKRFAPRYPEKDAIKGKEGCAVVEYVITPQYELKDIKVITATGDRFAKQARQVVTKWKWSDLPSGILQQAIKTRTQFQFCLEDGSGRCQSGAAGENVQCKGEDTIWSVGVRQ